MMLGNKEDSKVKRTLAWYNMIPNLFWSALNLTPISIYCFQMFDYTILCIFLTISSIPIFLKNTFLDKLQIAKTISVYKKLGVDLVNKVAQNGVIINKLMKNKFPDHKIVTSKKASISELIAQTYVFEKFHLILFLFFTLTMIFAFIKIHFIWAFIIFLTNIAYNIYPNLLQQYIRLKLTLFRKNYLKS